MKVKASWVVTLKEFMRSQLYKTQIEVRCTLEAISNFHKSKVPNQT